MNPYKFEINNGIVKFIYKYSDLKEWLQRGREHGDSGAILIGRDGLILKYSCFGTIENPTKDRYIMQMIHNEPFDGVLPTDEDIVKSRTFQPSYKLENFSFILLDLSNNE